MRFTKTWSPMSSVFSMELEGISKACTTNVMMNKSGDQHCCQRGEKLDRRFLGLLWRYVLFYDSFLFFLRQFVSS